MTPSVRIGIVTRNRAQTLPRAIGSGARQRGANIDIVVVDDGSTDETTMLSTAFPNVGWKRHEQSAGYIARRNELMQHGVSDYYVSLDDDAWFLGDDEIAVAIDYLEKNPGVAAVAFDILSPDRPKQNARTSAEKVASFIGCGHVLRKAALERVGSYESSPGLYGGEEKDLCLRLMDAGYEIIRLPGVHVWHDKTPLARELPKQHLSSICNDLAMTLRRTPLSLLPMALLSKLYKHLIFSLRHSLLAPCLAGIALFLKSIPAVWRSRRPVKTSTVLKFRRLARTS